jgi:hypothetical protein
MNGTRMRMSIDESDKDPNFHYAWFNDQSGLIQRAHKAGFVFVTRSEIPSWGEVSIDSADPTEENVTMDVGQGITAYLMKQPMEYYLEDKQAMDELVNSREADLKRELNKKQEESGYGKVTYGEVKISD